MAFVVRPAGVEEVVEGMPPHDLAVENARRKAEHEAAPGELVLGVDTVVVTQDQAVLGKPADADAAVASVTRLNGTTHTVVSGLAVVQNGVTRTAVASTEVTFRTLTAERIARYVATGEWRGRAGGYAIQERGAALVQGISGDYLNVVGLPVATLLDLLPDLL